MTPLGVLLTLGYVLNARQMFMALLFFGMFSLFFYLGGIGVRESSRFAAAAVFSVSALDTCTSMLTSPVSVSLLIKFAISFVLLSNLRATWVAAHWVPDTEESALPPRRSETLGDKFVDQWPRWIWPKIRIPYYVLAVLVAFLMLLGYVALLFRHAR